ncbi:MAG: 16S rRNA (guanine(966)-N(2))-methyltransferase RsmD [Ruminococcaceae bacterium]|nr:16S rRNA (guanine(966)-N(2))-methyltransferase RsmD [Oscillospiraceae bacterium]
MRIITGIARGIRLETLEGLETRPTPERVKESVFSMLQFELENRRVLDLFAGSGQMGLEALSRGALSCTFVEKNLDAMEIVKKNAKKTKLWDKCKIINVDYKDYLRNSKTAEKFDIVFLDPPYSQKIIPQILESLVKFDMLNNNAKVICESEDDVAYECEGLETVKHSKYGRVFITVLCKRGGNIDG